MSVEPAARGDPADPDRSRPTLTPVEFYRYAPPPPPPETHRAQLERLPPFPADAAGDRLTRGRNYLRDVEAFARGYHLSQASGLSVCRVISAGADLLLQGLWADADRKGEIPSGVALVALGSYGRRELSPHSDLDLLLLRGRASEAEVRPFASAFSTLLWDLKRTVGWSVRTASECTRAADEDHTVRTALLDARLVAGDAALFDELHGGSLRELLRHRGDAFIADKSRELRERRLKYGDSVFLLEPDVKKGEGGLRDLEAALWVAQARFRIRGLNALLKQSILPASEVVALKAARDFLLRVRHHLHYQRGRKEDRLTFDLQEEVARFMGYGEREAALPVEQFMRHYYLSAKSLVRAADGLIARCEEGRKRLRLWPTRRVGPFRVFQGRLTLGDKPELLRERPETVLELFRAAEAEGLPIDSWTRDQVSAALPELAKAVDRPEVTAAMKALFAASRSGRFLTDMHELGALGAVLPEFGRVTALHQHDLYHVYTVDVHTLFAVKRLYALRAGEWASEQPELTRRIRDLKDPLPLYLGMLLHDAGKGMGGGHSEHGLALARAVGARWGLSERQREVTEFLVHQHLTLSHVAQRRDLSDPELVAAFAREVGDAEKLTCLYLLTYADIASTGPSLWNAWKARLLHELFHKALHVLNHGGQSEKAPASEERARPFVDLWQRRWGPEAAHVLRARLPSRYFATT
ncbi:MAG TPA: [protein-PII] uridylyltransferase, partial [Myxococcaceae bacterium]|nr:[protein-PII] uridylyltransferase [Myxococcaceae bacterium]